MPHEYVRLTKHVLWIGDLHTNISLACDECGELLEITGSKSDCNGIAATVAPCKMCASRNHIEWLDALDEPLPKMSPKEKYEVTVKVVDVRKAKPKIKEIK